MQTRQLNPWEYLISNLPKENFVATLYHFGHTIYLDLIF
jgi:hypothetical protein